MTGYIRQILCRAMFSSHLYLCVGTSTDMNLWWHCMIAGSVFFLLGQILVAPNIMTHRWKEEIKGSNMRYYLDHESCV